MPTTAALLSYLLDHPGKVRLVAARDDLALTTRQVSHALRTLERHGLARQARSDPRHGRPGSFGRHLFIEATDEARGWKDPLPPLVTTRLNP